MRRLTHPPRTRTPGYTLVEMLIVVTVLGIAGAMIVPSFASTDVLRVQGAVRTIVSDLTVAQSDAIAFQQGRGVIFYDDLADPRYVIAEVNGTTLDPALDMITERHLGGSAFGFLRIEDINMPGDTLIFDELGGPVTTPGGSTPAAAGWIDIAGSDQRFRIHVEAYTGRVRVERLPDPG